MDTEGLHAIDDKSSDFDIKLFSITVIACSYFIYNSKGNIDEKSINQLSLVTHLIKNLKVKEYGRPTEYELSQYAPKFLWVLRDFVLEIQDVRKRVTTPQNYLESFLTDVVESGITENGKNIRESIISFFRFRDCVTLVRPCDEEEHLKKMENLPDEYLRDEFLTEINKIRDKIFKKCTSKIINGIQMNSRMFIVLIQTIIQSINDGQIPVIQKAWEILVQNEMAQYLKESIESYDEDLSEHFNNFDKPIEVKELNKIFNELRDKTLIYFNNISYLKEYYKNEDENDFENYREKLLEYINEKENKLRSYNLDLAQKENSLLFKRHITVVEENLPKYNENNIDNFNRDFDNFLNNFQSNPYNLGKIDILGQNIEQIIFNFYGLIYQSILTNNKDSINKMEKLLAEKNQHKEINLENMELYEQKLDKINDQIKLINENIKSKEKKKDEFEKQLTKFKEEEKELIDNKKEKEKQFDENVKKILELEQKLNTLKTKKKRFCCF